MQTKQTAMIICLVGIIAAVLGGMVGLVGMALRLGGAIADKVVGAFSAFLTGIVPLAVIVGRDIAQVVLSGTMPGMTAVPTPAPSPNPLPPVTTP